MSLSSLAREHSKTLSVSFLLTDGLELVLRKPVARLGERAVLLRR